MRTQACGRGRPLGTLSAVSDGAVSMVRAIGNVHSALSAAWSRWRSHAGDVRVGPADWALLRTLPALAMSAEVAGMSLLDPSQSSHRLRYEVATHTARCQSAQGPAGPNLRLERKPDPGRAGEVAAPSRVMTDMDLRLAGLSAEATRRVAMTGSSVKKESTASTLVYSFASDGWRLCLIVHPRLGKLLPAGGHVERDETTAEAAVREVLEETGLQVRLLPPSAVPLPPGTPHVPVPPAWWTLEMQVPADRHEPRPHIHVDSIYVAIADQPASVPAAHEVVWLTAAELAEHPDVVDDTRILAKEVFAIVESLPA
jgi:8-oxo-dGTP pyrophosphatase MutT (NUDIX family)